MRSAGHIPFCPELTLSDAGQSTIVKKDRRKVRADVGRAFFESAGVLSRSLNVAG